MYPYKGKFRVTSIQGLRWGVPHNGLDLVGMEDKVIYAVRGGTVLVSNIIDKSTGRVEWQFGNRVMLRDDLGRIVLYNHLSKRLVKQGDVVKAGDPIGIEGGTGYCVPEGASHLHIEVRDRQGVGYKTFSAAEYIGISNQVGIYGTENKMETIDTAQDNAKRLYTHDGITCYEFPVKSLKLSYWDKPKNEMSKYSVAFNCGFFANFKEKVGNSYQYFTLPVGNLVADAENFIPPVAKKYILEWTKNSGITSDGKIRMSSSQNPYNNGTKLSTLIVYRNGDAEVIDTNSLPSDATYACSAVPTVRKGDDVNYYQYVAQQFKSADVMRPTMRNWIGITKSGKLILLNYSSRTNNYIYGMEVWKKVRDMTCGIQELLGLDGGGSAYAKIFNNVYKTTENRQVNNVGLVL